MRTLGYPHLPAKFKFTLCPLVRRTLPELTNNMADNRQVYTLWKDIQDIIGDASRWPHRIRRLFSTINLLHWQRILLAAFVYVNGLNPDVFMEWANLLHLCRDGSGYRHFNALFNLFPDRNYTLYAYNVSNNRYEYLDGRVRRYVHASLGH